MELITIDIDWAPDWMIIEIAELLLKAKVKATWFATHSSKGIEALLREEKFFEVGIHPNCLPGSTQGSNEDEIMDYLKGFFPDAKSMRTHALYSHTNFLNKAAQKYGIEIDVSIFFPYPNVIPYKMFFEDGSQIWRVPFWWEDDLYMYSCPDEWDINKLSSNNSVKIYNFHCVHICLNTEDYARYKKLKQIQPNVNTWERSFVERFKNFSSIHGTRRIFSELIEKLHNSGGGKTIREFIREHANEYRNPWEN